MKIKTRKLIAAITATALLGASVGVSAYALGNKNNDFGFKGTYDLTAFAAANETPTTVAGTAIDVTDFTTINSTGGDYKLYIAVIDNSDAKNVTAIKVGYKIGDTYYNGTNVGLSSIAYSSLTVKTSATTSETINASDYTMVNATNNGTAEPMFIITEVASSVTGTAELKVTTKDSIAEHNFTAAGTTSNFFEITGNLSTSKGTATYNGLSLTQCLKMESSTSIKFTLEEASTVTLVFGPTEKDKSVKYGLQTTASDKLTVGTTDASGMLTLDLDPGDYQIARVDTANLFYIDIIAKGIEHSNHTYSLGSVTKVPTATEEGAAVLNCSVGGETKPVVLPVLTDGSYNSSLVSDDHHDKVTSYTYTTDGVEISFEATETTHAYSETISSVSKWNWNNESNPITCTADVVYKCAGCDETKAATVDATVTNNGDGSYTATIEGTSFTNTYVYEKMPTYEELLAREDIKYQNDFTTAPEGGKFAELSDYNTAGVFSIPKATSASTETIATSYTGVKDGATLQVANTANKQNTITAVAFGDVSTASVIQGYFKIKTTDVGTKWDIIKFVNSSGSNLFAVRTDEDPNKNRLVYTLNADANNRNTPSETFVFAANTTYEVYFKINVTSGTITVNITDGKKVFNVSGVSIGENSISGLNLSSSSSGKRLTSIDDLVICAS